MPSFDYTAIDRQGNSVQGQVQAASRDEAALSLTQTGLLVSRLSEAGAAPIQQSARIQATPAPQPQIQMGGTGRMMHGAPPVLKPAPAPATTKAAPAVRSVPQTSPKPPIRTKRGSDKDIYFIFSQLQSYAKSGQNPVVAFTNVANGCRRPDYAEALRATADAAKEGRPMSDVFERYVDLFPPHVVGMVRAAEKGGFFPEAYDLITDQAHASDKFRIWFVWLLAVAIMVGLCLPLTALMVRAALVDWDAQEKAGGMAPPWGTLFASIGKELIWPSGPVILALIIGSWAFARFWQALANRDKRHRMALVVPSVNKRARAESLSVFAWTMGNLAKVGLPPKAVWELSAATVPNLEIRRQLEETGQRMSEQTKLSEAMTMSRQVPDEYAPIVQTGEITGDVPGALIRASQSQLEEFKAGDQGAKARVGCWILLLLFLGSAIMFGIFYGSIIGKFVDQAF
ncbi:MAG: type II secretion system F family protein [Fimbriimonadales bacterium]